MKIFAIILIILTKNNTIFSNSGNIYESLPFSSNFFKEKNIIIDSKISKDDDEVNNYSEKNIININLEEVESLKNESKKIVNEINIEEIKSNINNIKKNIGVNSSNNNLFNKFYDLIKQIKSNTSIINKLINEYQETIYKYISNQYYTFISQEHENTLKDEINIKKINNLCIILGKLEEEIKKIDNEFILIHKEENEYKESIKKNPLIIPFQGNEDSGENKSNKESSKIIESKKLKGNIPIIHINEKIFILEEHLEKILTFSYEVKKRLLDTKKNLIKNFISQIKNKFTSYKNQINLNDKFFNNEINILKTKEKKLIAEKAVISEKIEKEKKGYIENSNEKLAKIFSEHMQKINEKSFHEREDIELKKIIENITIDIQNSNISIINGNIIVNQKDIEIVEGWKALLFTNTNIAVISNILKKYYSIATKNNIDNIKQELTKYIDKYELYKSFLNNYIQLIKVDKTTQLKKNDTEKIKNILSKINEKKNEISNLLSNIKNISYITSILKEELKKKTFWARSEYSIGIDKLKNFIPSIKLFTYETYDKLIPQILLVYKKLKDLYLYNFYLLFLWILSIILFIFISLLYKKVLILISLFIDNIAQQSYQVRQINFLISTLANRSILFYLWINTFLLFYYNVIKIPYFASLFYISSTFITIYFLHKIINFITTENIYLQEDNSNNNEHNTIKNKVKKFFMHQFIIYLITILFFLRLSMISVNNEASGEILLAAQIILIQIQLIIFLKKKYTIPYIMKIKFLGDSAKEIISEYYKFFMLVFTMIIIMTNPYVGYGYQVIYILLRSIVTIPIIPIFNKLFEEIKKQSIFFFFNFDEGEAKKKN